MYLTSALDGVSVQNYAPAAVPPGRNTGAHCVGGCLGNKDDLDGHGENFLPAPGYETWSFSL